MTKIKIYKAFQAYGTYIDNFYSQSSFSNIPYCKQIESLSADCFPWILSWHIYNCNKDVEIFETIHNAPHLQKTWAKENGIKYNDSNWQVDIVLKQIEKFQPDVCVIYPPEIFNDNILSQIRSCVHHDLLIGGYDGMNRLSVFKYEGYDFVITCSKYISKYYYDNGIKSYPLEFGFDPKINNLLNANNHNLYNVTFCGSLFPNVHKQRFKLVSYLSKHTPIVISSDYESDVKYTIFSKKTIKSIFTLNQEYFNKYSIHRRNIGAKYGIEMFQFLHDSKITINSHGDDIYFAANVRLYEATGVGTCLLTDWKENIAEIFEPNVECITYTTKEEAVDKIKFLLKHDDLRKRIALQGQRKTISNYTYNKRIEGVINYIKSLL